MDNRLFSYFDEGENLWAFINTKGKSVKVIKSFPLKHRFSYYQSFGRFLRNFYPGTGSGKPFSGPRHYGTDTDRDTAVFNLQPSADLLRKLTASQ